MENNKLKNLDSITFIRNPTKNSEVSDKKGVDDELNRSTFMRFNQSLQNNIEVTVGNTGYNFIKYG